MKYVIITLCLVNSLVLMAQSNIVFSELSIPKSETKGNFKTEIIWEENFDEGVEWICGNNLGEKYWNVSDTTPDFGYYYDLNNDGFVEPIPPIWIYTGRNYVNEYSESGGNFAWIDAISDILSGNMEIFDAWIKFENIDLSVEEKLQLSFYQKYRKLNNDYCFVEFSSDGGLTWESKQLNMSTPCNNYSDNFVSISIPEEFDNCSNLCLRFRYGSTTSSSGGYGYGWEIDDIQISKMAENDFRLLDSRLRFMTCFDSEYPEYYNYSSYYSAIPSPYSYDYPPHFCFTAVVQNKSYLNYAPKIKIEVLGEDSELIWSDSITIAIVESYGIDTVYFSENPFDLTSDDFYLNNDLKFVFTVCTDGLDDNLPYDNNDTIPLKLSDYFARDNNKLTKRISTSIFSDGNINKDKIGNVYTIFRPLDPDYLYVFIDSATSPGTSIRPQIYIYSEESGEGEYVLAYSGSWFPITESSLNSWVKLSFGVEGIASGFWEGEMPIYTIAAVEFNYGEPDALNNIYIGSDQSEKASLWGTMWFLKSGTYANQWKYRSGWEISCPAIRVYDKYGFCGSVDETTYICSDETYNFMGIDYDETGVYTSGMLPTYTLNLFVLEAPQVLSVNTCYNIESESWEVSITESENDVNYKLYYSKNSVDSLLSINTGNGSHLYFGAFSDLEGGSFKVLAKAENNMCDRLMNITNTEYTNKEETNIEIYPNPTSESIHISTEEYEFTISIYNSVGQLVFSGKNITSISVRDFEQGEYVVKYKSNKNIISKSLIIN